MVASEEDYDRLVKDVVEEFPDFSLVAKAESRLMRAIGFLLKVMTFGKNSSFMTSFTTTIGDTVYTPTEWMKKTAEERIRTLRHERIHLRQQQRHGRAWFSFLYIFAWFPIGFAKFRRDFEMEAYEETLRAIVEQRGAQFIFNRTLKDRIVSNFVSANYFWTWYRRKDIEKWYDDARERILEEHLK